MGARQDHLKDLPFTLLRYYVCTLPAMAEGGWRRNLSFDRLTPEQRSPGHWYHVLGDRGVIEVRADGSGQWHPEGVTPSGGEAVVVEVPLIEGKHLLLDEIIAALDNDERTAADPDLKEIREHIAELGQPASEQHMVSEFQRVLATIPDVPDEKLRFLVHASLKILRLEMTHGRATGSDAAALLLFQAVARQLLLSPDDMHVILRLMATREATSLDELAATVVRECWNRRLQVETAAALDELRQQGEAVLQQARDTSSVEADPKHVLPYYYGGILEALPYMLACFDGYDTLSEAPCTAEEKARYLKRKNTAEEKVVRLRDALLHAVRDRDLSELFSRQAFLRLLMQQGKYEQAESFVHDLIDLKFYYPPLFRDVLLPPQPPA